MSRAAWPQNVEWLAYLAILGVLSLPALAAWSSFVSHAPGPIRQFRLEVTLAGVFLGVALVFLRQRLVDRERPRLLHGLQDSLYNLPRLQTQFVQAGKLASLGQLAAGAAHEINNPLIAIFGYSDLPQMK